MFSALIQGAYVTKVARQNKRFADTYRYDRVLRKALVGLSNHAADKRRLRYLCGAALFQRLTPKAFACLKMNTHRQQQKRSQVTKAAVSYDMNLKQKALRGIFKASIKASLKKVEIARAQEFYDGNLKQRALGLVKQGVQQLKDRKAKRYCMARALLKVDNEITLKTAFTYFKLGITLH